MRWARPDRCAVLPDGPPAPAFAAAPFVSYVPPVTPELNHRPNLTAVAIDAPQVFVSREVLRRGALSLVGGAVALWAASHSLAVLAYFQTQDFIGYPLLFAAVAAALPIQLITLTRPLVKEVLETSTAPAWMKLVAALAVSGGSILTALAWWRAFGAMCAIAM